MATKKPTKKSYNELSQQLNEIIEWFESEDLNLDDALPKYEEAMLRIAELEKYLKTAENKIQKINIRFEK